MQADVKPQPDGSITSSSPSSPSSPSSLSSRSTGVNP